jgi:polyadenylate-binding protein
MTEGKGTVIQGRACRTEMVKANREFDCLHSLSILLTSTSGAFIIFHNHGGPLTVEEARKALGQYGPLSKCEPLDTQMQDVLNLGPSVLVEFTTFDPTRDIQAVSNRYFPPQVVLDCCPVANQYPS